MVTVMEVPDKGRACIPEGLKKFRLTKSKFEKEK